MECSFCHNYLDRYQIKNQDTLKLCCGVNEIFCLNCLFSPTIIQASLINNIIFTCQECHQIVTIQRLLKKRLQINLGSYCNGKFKFGYTHFLKPNSSYNPQTAKKSFAVNAELNYKYGVPTNTDNLYFEKSKNSGIFNSIPRKKTEFSPEKKYSTNSKNLFNSNYH